MSGPVSQVMDRARPPWLPDGYRPDGPRLAAGPVADVWPAIEVLTGRRVALKLWHQPLRGRRATDLYRREQDAHRLLAGLSGHVVSWAGGQEHRALPWLATTLHGMSLRAYLDRAGHVEPATAAQLGMDLARGVAAVHLCGLLHRDVKPGNVLVRDGRAVLSDFGLAMVTGDTVLDPRAGTPRYRAPELLHGAPPRQSADVYSAGLVLRELFGDPAPHVALERVLLRATSARREDRPSNGMELASWLSDACASAGLAVLPPREPDPAPPHLLHWREVGDRDGPSHDRPFHPVAALFLACVFAFCVLVGLYVLGSVLYLATE